MIDQDRDAETAAKAAVWRAHIDAWRRGNVSQRVYCEAHGLSRKSFANWRQRFQYEEAVLERNARRKRKARALHARDSGARVALPADRRCPQRAPLRQPVSGRIAHERR
jgi:hypothetical protein